MSPKTEKKSWGQSLYAIIDIGSPQTIRVCHIFRFSKNPEIWENLNFWVIRGLARKRKMLQVSNFGPKHPWPVTNHR